ncbi:MFS transporter [Paenibacillus aceris]|uniref:Oligogalacturonide transporter n=1 Tax=Paenibacillus aceris TaxID=869555 RepID=A0ABS4HWF0_9BACL|nr:MFS transporter [Paenibacillus aceris]MBP1962972.1 oligogalacturonide transporter [Paenibacillus aceris]NHW38398.1 MFS transporter [Paenibacillus aceris]
MEKKIGLRHSLAYGGGNFLGSGALAVSGAWLLYFYTTFCGLSIVQAASIFSIATFVDAISNPIMGFISDNFHKTKIGRKFGRRRFFIMLGIPLMLVYPMLWIHGFGYWYYLVTYLLFELIYTAVMIPYESLAAEMTKDFGARSRLTGFKAIFGKLANFAAAFIPGRFIAMYGKDSPTPFLSTGLVFAGILIIALIFLYVYSWERSPQELEMEAKKEPSLSFVESMKKLFIDLYSTFQIKSFRHHLGMYLGGFSAEWLFTSVFTYFVIFSMHQGSENVSNLSSFNSVIQLVATYIFISYVVKKGFSKPFINALVIVSLSVLGYLAIFLIQPSHTVMWLYAVTFVMGFATGGVYYIPWNQYTFMADIDEAVTGRRREGIYAGVMTFAGKLVRSIIVFLLGWCLQQYGFVSKAATQPISAQYAIVGVMVIGTIVLGLFGIWASALFKLNMSSHKVLVNEIERLKSGGSMKDVTPESRAVFEKLTGFDYEKCWGNNRIGYKSKLQ